MSEQRPTDSWYLRGLLFFVVTPLLALSLLLAITATSESGPSGKPLSSALAESSFWWELGVVLLPFVIIGMAAGATSKRGASVGWCTWAGGIAFVGATHLVGYLGYRQAIQAHASTGAAMTMGLVVCAAVPAAIVGSLIGLATGVRLAKRRNSRGED